MCSLSLCSPIAMCEGLAGPAKCVGLALNAIVLALGGRAPRCRKLRWAPTALPSPSCCSTRSWQRGMGRRQSGWGGLQGWTRCTASTPWPTTASASARGGAGAGGGGLPAAPSASAGQASIFGHRQAGPAAPHLTAAQRQHSASMQAVERHPCALPAAANPPHLRLGLRRRPFLV
jgi:hypothetical protein